MQLRIPFQDGLGLGKSIRTCRNPVHRGSGRNCLSRGMGLVQFRSRKTSGAPICRRRPDFARVA